MSSKPYFKLYFSDLAGDTLRLSDAEIGSYVLLLGAMWNAGGALSFDHKDLARIARVTPAKWGARWQRLKPFFVVKGGRVTHKRLTEERKKVDEISSVNSQNGTAGVEAKRLKRLGVDQANASENDQRTASHTKARTRRTPRTPQGGPVEIRRWDGPEAVREIVTDVLGPDGAGYLLSFTWRELPEKVLVTASPTMLAKLKPCEPALAEKGWSLTCEKRASA